MILNVNLATKRLETHRRFRTFSATIGLIATIALVVLSWHVYAIRKAEATFRTESAKTLKEIDALTAQRENLDHFFSQPENAQLHDRASFINTIIDERSFNWTNMFMDLEKVLPLGVHVTDIEPKQVSNQAIVKLTVGAASDEAKIKFLQELEQSSVFSHLQLVTVRAPQQETGDQVVLELTVIYSRAW